MHIHLSAVQYHLFWSCRERNQLTNTTLLQAAIVVLTFIISRTIWLTTAILWFKLLFWDRIYTNYTDWNKQSIHTLPLPVCLHYWRPSISDTCPAPVLYSNLYWRAVCPMHCQHPGWAAEQTALVSPDEYPVFRVWKSLYCIALKWNYSKQREKNSCGHIQLWSCSIKPSYSPTLEDGWSTQHGCQHPLGYLAAVVLELNSKHCSFPSI